MIPIIGPILAALNTFSLMLIFIALAFGIGLGLFLTAYLVPNARIMYCIERDKRGLELNVSKEDHISIDSKSKPPLRFWKVHGSYEFPARFGKKISTFFAKEGTAYLWKLLSGKVTKEFKTLEAAVQTRWGEKFYATVPEEQKEKLRADKVLVTVELEKGMTPKGFTPITEKNIGERANQDMANIFSRAANATLRGVTWQHIAFIGTGIGIGVIACILMGWIPVGA